MQELLEKTNAEQTFESKRIFGGIREDLIYSYDNDVQAPQLGSVSPCGSLTRLGPFELTFVFFVQTGNYII